MKFPRIALSVVLLLTLLSTAAAFAQTNTQTSAEKPKTGENPFSTWNKGAYAHTKSILLRSADKMPEENYNFKPVDSVRTYGQIIGHLADAQYLFCSLALGEKGPDLKIEQTKTSKADLIAALKEAFTYCDRAYDTMTDTSGAPTVKFFGIDTPKLDVLTINNMHNMEHYGNLVTYMRMKNIVPPTSESGNMPSHSSDNAPPKK